MRQRAYCLQLMQWFAFMLVPGFSAMAFFSALEPLRIANRLAGRQLYGWTIHAPLGDHALASNGMQLRTDRTLPGQFDALVVCAGFEPLQPKQAGLLGQVRRTWRAGKQVGGIDTGAFLLAEAGILGQEPITLHWEAAAEFRRQYPRIPVSTELYERHARLFTCAGGTAAMDMMLDDIASNHGLALAVAVSEQLIYDRIRPATAPQRNPVAAQTPETGPVVRRLVAAMGPNAGMAPPLETILEREGISRRHAERLFQLELGVSPARYYRELRIRHAIELMRNARLSVHEAALAAGFSSQPVFSRACRQHFGQSPRALLMNPSVAAGLSTIGLGSGPKAAPNGR